MPRTGARVRRPPARAPKQVRGKPDPVEAALRWLEEKGARQVKIAGVDLDGADDSLGAGHRRLPARLRDARRVRLPAQPARAPPPGGAAGAEARLPPQVRERVRVLHLPRDAGLAPGEGLPEPRAARP